MHGFFYALLVFSLSGCLAHPAEPTEPDTTTWTPDPLCPYPSEKIYFFTDEDDCSKYIECYEGVKYIRDCAAGLLWDEEELACDYAKNVDCHSRPAPSTTERPSTETTEPSNATTEETSESSTELSAGSSDPSTETSESSTEPSAGSSDPSAQTSESSTEASAGSTDPSTGTSESSTETSDGSSDPSTETSEETTTEPPTSESDTTDTQPPRTTLTPDDYCKHLPDGTYIPDSSDCKRFYECSAGKAFDGVCPTGTVWNEDILNCDRPENVECK